MPLLKRPLLRSLLLALPMLGGGLSHALDAHPGDSVAPPPGSGLIGLYGIHQDLDPQRSQGRDVSGPKAKVDVGLLRVLYATKLGDWQVNPQVVIPYGRVGGAGTLSSTGGEQGLGDISLLASVMLLQDPASRTSVYLLPGVVLKTGAYDKNKLSIGENRNKYLLQIGAQTGIAKDWIIDGYADITSFGTDSDHARGARKQAPMLSLQTFIRYAVSPGTELAAGLRHYRRGENRYANVDTSDKVQATAMLLTASYWLDGKTQIMGNWGKDLSRNNGFKAANNIELRAVRLF